MSPVMASIERDYSLNSAEPRRTCLFTVSRTAGYVRGCRELSRGLLLRIRGGENLAQLVSGPAGCQLEITG
jgi:ferredoxin-NADP reductase